MTIVTKTLFVLTTGLLAFAAGANAQHARQHGAGEHTGHRSVEACEREFEQVVADGRGFGMAFAADRHGYPGPLHVLELAGRLGLTPDQETRVKALMDRMFAESRPNGARLLAAERRLTELFRAGQADEARVRQAVQDVERWRAELRALHLTTHLRTRDLLTAEQRRIYHVARWAE